MGRKIILLTLLSLWICGCLAMSSAKRATTSSIPRYDESLAREEEMPTPRLFGIDLDLSYP
jgi:hypothetical protein